MAAPVNGNALVPAILNALDTSRAIGGLLGKRILLPMVRRRVWTGERPGIGTFTDTDIFITNTGALPTTAVSVQMVSQKDIVASGGLYRDRDMRVGPITPPFAATSLVGAGGFDDTTVDPAPTTQAVELFWNVSGQGMPTGGEWCMKIGEEVTWMHYTVILRAGASNPGSAT